VFAPIIHTQTLITTPSDSREASVFLSIATNTGLVGAAHSAWAAEPLDWDRLIAFALLENGVTILEERVSSLPEGSVPPEKREQIARLALVWTLKLKLLERRLHESIRLLSAAGIDITLLKGAGLALTVYRRFEDRPMADIDLLVDVSRASEAQALMQQNGWTLDIEGHPAEAWTEHHHLPPLLDTRGSGLRLELHVAPIPPGHSFSLDLVKLKESCPTVLAEGIPVRVLEPHMHAVHSAIHFAWCHRFVTGSMNVFRDFGAIAKSPGFSWSTFVEIARQTRSETACYWTLRLAREMTGLAVPEESLAALAPAMNDLMLSILARHFTQLVLRSEGACPSSTLRHRLWAFALQTDKARIDEAMHWDAAVKQAPPRMARRFLRLPSHALRIRAWSLYMTSMFTVLTG
jgi:hypothetical protein